MPYLYDTGLKYKEYFAINELESPNIEQEVQALLF